MNNGLHNIAALKGLFAVIMGLMLIVFSYGVILKMILFSLGFLLLYYGLQTLNIKALESALHTVHSHIKRFLP